MSSSKELQWEPSSWAATSLNPMSQTRTLFERELASCDTEKRSYMLHRLPGPHGYLGSTARVELRDRAQSAQGGHRG